MKLEFLVPKNNIIAVKIGAFSKFVRQIGAAGMSGIGLKLAALFIRQVSRPIAVSFGGIKADNPAVSGLMRMV